MKTSKRLSKSILLSFIFSLVLAGCGSAGGAASSDSPSKEAPASKGDKVVHIGYQKGNTLNILKESGYLEKDLKEQGYTVEWSVFATGAPLMEALVAGSIDFGHSADGGLIFNQAANKPFVYVGADLPNPEGVGVMVLKDSSIKTVADLKGKKIATLKGGNHHYLAVLALQQAGLSTNDVEWVYVTDAAQGRAAFESKRVDALASWDPFYASVQIDMQPVALTEGVDFQYPNRTFYAANSSFAEKQPGLIKTILTATNKSDKWANDNKPEVIKLLATSLGIDEKVMTKALNRRQYGVDNINDAIIAAQQKQADVYKEVGLIPENIKVADIMPLNPKWAIE